MLLTIALLTLPPCDFTIRSKADWAHVNDQDKNVICVAAAPTYTYEDVGVVQLSASGTADKPRWLRWANEDPSVHPALVPSDQTAAISQFDLIGSNWVVDRLVVRDAIYQPRVMGNMNRLQRMVFEKPRVWEGRQNGLMLHLTSGSENAVVDSVFRESYRARGADSYAIYIHHAAGVTISGNEFIDLVGGVQSGPEAGGGHYIVDNEFYHTPAIYTDCRGIYTSTGNCSCSEGMAVVAKGPANQAQSYIERNVVWGFKRSDPTCAGTGSPGTAFDFGSGAKLTRHFIVRDNVIIADVPSAIYLGRSVEDMTIQRNRIAGSDNAISNVYGERVDVSDNTFLGKRVQFVDSPSAGTLCVTTHHLTGPRNLCVLGVASPNTPTTPEVH